MSGIKKQEFVIYKYKLKLENEQIIEVPGLYKVLAVKSDGCIDIDVWIMVDLKMPLIKLKFFIVGTGYPFGYDIASSNFVDTVEDRLMRWHVFYKETN